MGCTESQDHNAQNTLTKPHIFFVIGGPGSGKGTQCQYLVRDYKFKHLSAGDLLREQKSKGGKNAQQIQSYIKKGQLVPSQIIIKLLKKEITKNGNRKYLIDGFPRNQENWQNFQKTLKNHVIIRNMIFFDCPHNVMIERIMERGKTSGRVDDNQDTIKLRLNTYQKQTLPVVQKFKQLGNCLIINSNQDKLKVYQQVCNQLQNINVKQPLPTPVFFVLGGPGSGKGTQCSLLVEKYGFKHLSTGDLLRQEVKKGSKLGNQINNCMKEGKLVQSDLLVQLIKNKFQWNNYGGKYLIDGFPRNQQNIQSWNKIISNSVDLKAVFYFKCQQEQLKKRLIQRGKTSGRIDDNQQTITKRLKTFYNETKPLVQYYQKLNKLKEFDALKSISQIFENVQDYVQSKGIMIRKVSQAKVLLVLGGPGSGKGTQCDKLKANFGFYHLSTGDLLRQQQKNQGLQAQYIAQQIAQGKMVSSQILLKLVRKQIQKYGAKGIFMLDGFPRNQQNVQQWNQQFGIQIQIKNLIYFQCSQSELEKRLLNRGKNSGRSDDNPQTIKKRIQTFKKQTQPILQKYNKKNNFLIKINSQKNVDQVYQELNRKLKQHGY